MRTVRLPTLPHVAVVTGLGGVVVLACWWWANPAFNLWETADGTFHLLRSYVFADLLQRGVWFPRWVPDLYLGYGYPVFNYVPPLPYYLAAVGHFLGLDRYGGLQAVGVLAVVAGVTGAFSLARALWQSNATGFLAAVAYGLAPYPFLNNLYFRGNVPEALALGLLPWLLWASWRWWHAPRWSRAVLPALLTAFLVLTHNITAFLGVGLLLAWLLCLLCSGTCGISGVRVISAKFSIVLAGLALSAYFWLPALGERDFVHIKFTHQGFLDLREWLIDPLGAKPNSRWLELDYTGTPFGPLDLHWTPTLMVSGHGPYKLHPLQLVLLAFVVGGLVAAIRRRDRRNSCLLAYCSLVAVGCWFLLTAYSAAIWPHLPLLRDIQFPWRLYGPADLMLALGVAGGVRLLWPDCLTQTRRAYLLVVAGLGVFLIGTAFRGVATQSWPTLGDSGRRVGATELRTTEVGKYVDGLTDLGEYLPRAVEYARWSAHPQLRGRRLYEALVPEHSWLGGLVRPLKGRLQVTGLWAHPTATTVEVQAETPATLAFHTLDFPGWQVYLDGRPVPHRAAPYNAEHRAELGFIVVDVPPGHHRLHLELRPTPLRALGTGLSLLAAAGLVLGSLVILGRHWHTLLKGANPSHDPTRRWWLAIRSLLLLGAAGLVLVVSARALRYVAGPDQLARAADSRIVLDFTLAAERGQAALASPDGSSLGSYIDLRWLRVVDEERSRQVLVPEDQRWWPIINRERRWLYMHPPATITVETTIPPGAIFQTGLAVDPVVWHRPDAHGVRFLLEVATPDGWSALLNRHVAPRQRAADRRWIDEVVDLEALAGQTVTLRLRTEPVATLAYGWGGWAEPMILVRETARYD